MKLCRQTQTGLSGGAILRQVSIRKSDTTIDAINNLPGDLRTKVLSRAWTEMATVVNEQRIANGGQAPRSCGDFDEDWRNLEIAVWRLLEAEREKALEAFYRAVTVVLRNYNEPSAL